MRMLPRTEIVNGHETTSIGPHRRAVYLANMSDRDWTSGRWIFHFGAYGDHSVLAYGTGFEAALETAAEYALERWPGLSCTDAVREEYNRQIADGATEDAAWEAATVDTLSVDGGEYLSWEWSYTDCPDRAALEGYCYPAGVTWTRDDGCVPRAVYQPTRGQMPPVVPAPSHRDLWSDVVLATIAAGRSEAGTLAILEAIGDM